MIIRLKRFSASLAIVLALLWTNATGQVSPSMYFMDHLPGAGSLNPAFHPPNNFFIDLPLISSTYLSAEIPFTYSELTTKNLAEDRLYIDKRGVISSMDKVGTISFNLNSELARTGFRAGKHFISFGVSKVFATDISVERDLVEFLLYGNGSEAFLGNELNLDKTGFKSSFYHEFALGWAVHFSDKLTGGVRLKYLNGVLNAWSEKTDFTFYTDPDNNYALSASTDLLVHTAAASGYLDELDFADPMDYLMVSFTGNHGFAGDLGFAYRPMERLQVSASAVDLGAIRWKEHVKSYYSKYPDETFTFEGFDIHDLLNGGRVSDSITILDSLDEHFSIETITGGEYTSMLTPKAYLGVTYNVTRHDQFGLLIRGKFPEHNFLTAYTLNYRRTFGDVFAAYVNYTFKKNFNHFGFGFSLRAGPLMFYAMNDMFDTLFQPTRAKGYNVQFGISLVFGMPYRDAGPVGEEETAPPEAGPPEGTD